MTKTGMQVLRDAVRRLDGGRRWQRGAWRRKVFMQDTQEAELNYCILGSLGMQTCTTKWIGQQEAVDLLCEVATEQHPGMAFHTPYDLMRFNDMAKSPADVVALVEKAYVRSMEPKFDDAATEGSDGS